MPILTGDDFTAFSVIKLNELGQFMDGLAAEARPVPSQRQVLAQFLKGKISLPPGTTDVFVWVHGWQTGTDRAVANAQRLFANLASWLSHEQARYPRLAGCVPAFVAILWPSVSTPGLVGYRQIRDRATAMTTAGHAASFLASLLGYLDANNVREPNRKLLRAKGGFYVHCLGHSFGGRFLTAAIQAAAAPTDPPRRLLSAAHRDTQFAFTVDSLCVLQMAAPATAFGEEFLALLDRSPLSGPIVLTHSAYDRALCFWHGASEFEAGIGCRGALTPAQRIGAIALKSPAMPYSDQDFAADITNVDASARFTDGGAIEGAHSDFWHEETFHLIASIAEQVR